MKVDIDFKLTEAAARELKRFRSELDGGTGEEIVRIVVGGGCSGRRRDIIFVPKEDANPSSDFQEEFHGISVVVDRSSLLKLDGATLDWVVQGNDGGFKFESSSSCGGGSCCKK